MKAYLQGFFQHAREPEDPRRKGEHDRAAFYFAVFCLAVFFRVITVNHLPERIIDRVWAFEVSVRLEYISLYGLLPVYVALLGSLFTIPRIGVVQRIVGAFALIGVAAALFLPVPLFSRYTLPPFQMLTLATGVFLIHGLAGCVRRREAGAVPLLAGCAVFFLVVINDILHAALIIRTAHLMPMGMLVFVVAHFIVLTSRHAGAEAQTRRLAEALARQRDSLDDRVRERTAALELTNEKLRRHEEARLEFVATISHELRTPLTLIKTPLDQAKRGKYGAALDVDGGILQSVRRNAQRIQTLIDNLLDYSRFELGRLVPQNVPVEVRSMVSSLAAELTPVAEEKGLALHCIDALTDEAWIEGDPRLLELAFFNLVSNALKFTPPGGTVEVTIAGGGVAGTVEVAVADSGVGITDEDKPHIFEKFYCGCREPDWDREPDGGQETDEDREPDGEQGTDGGQEPDRGREPDGEQGAGGGWEPDGRQEPDVDREPDGEQGTDGGQEPDRGRESGLSGETVLNGVAGLSHPGTGLGLPLTRTILDLHRGELQVQSISGEGSTFTMVLPLAAHVKQTEVAVPVVGSVGTARPTAKPAISPEAHASGHVILVVEDNAELLAYITEALSERYEVLSAVDGEDALLRITGPRRPDLVVTDIMMPGMDGAALFKAVRRTGQYPDMPFLFLTARSDKELETDLRREGAVDYIRKPFDLEDLVLKVRNLMDLRSGVRSHTEAEYTRRLTSFLKLSGTGTADPWDSSTEPIPNSPLTDREKQICFFLAQGMTDKEIGRSIGISGRTVSNTLVKLYRKYGVTNRTELTTIIRR